jgi:1,4-dihydroxy-6-naphthoate synthase
MASLKLGFSPCPNDTFIFAALVNGWIDLAFDFEIKILDVETLNELALKEKIDISKTSFHLFCYVQKKYCFLPIGAALGYECGPILVTRPGLSLNDLYFSTIAVPGKYTTAYLLLRLYAPRLKTKQVIFCPFNQIIRAVQTKSVDFGLIIHEGRFIYSQYGLKSVLDLGKWWENEMHLPLPLGGIIARRCLDKEVFSQKLKESILFAYKYPDKVMGYVKQHAAYLDDKVIKSHIKLYVNEFSLNLDNQGKKAITTLIQHVNVLEDDSYKLFC